MTPITASIDIARSPEEVFAYLADVSRHPEWQSGLQEVKADADGPLRAGARFVERRKVPGGVRQMTIEMTEVDAPSGMAFRGVDGPVRVVGKATISPADGGSQVTVEIDFEGRGLGKLLLPLVRSQARKDVPRDQQRLKERLEAGSA
jgi:uncharacterized protein YndB with AHSA1/START domain